MLTVLNRIGEERREMMSTDDFLAVNALFYEERLPDRLRYRVKRLVDMGIVEQVSRNKFVLARSIYAAVGKTGIRTRMVGLDRETNKELLVRHITDSGEKGAPLHELMQVLPGHSRMQIQALLRELRYSGRVYLIGHTRAARWFLSPKVNGN